MNNVVLLERMIPMYSFAEEEIAEEKENADDWLDGQKEIGDTGEALVKSYLERQYGAVVEKQLDSKGFDYMVTMPTKKFAVEVKTTTNSLKRFFISYNELKTAKRMREDYYLYYVCIRKTYASLYVICNPIKTLQVSSDLIDDTIIDNEMIEAGIEGLVITIKNLDSFLVIEDLRI